jgi:carbon-monoxide dehydrogenase medium subunit
LISASDFFRGVFETALQHGEIVTAVVLPPPEVGDGAAYEKLSLVAGDFAIVSVAAIVAETARIAIGGCGPKPMFASDIDLTDDALLSAGKQMAAYSDPPCDQRASAAYRRRVVPELIRRAVRAAQASA